MGIESELSDRFSSARSGRSQASDEWLVNLYKQSIITPEQPAKPGVCSAQGFTEWIRWLETITQIELKANASGV